MRILLDSSASKLFDKFRTSIGHFLGNWRPDKISLPGISVISLLRNKRCVRILFLINPSAIAVAPLSPISHSFMLNNFKQLLVQSKRRSSEKL